MDSLIEHALRQPKPHEALSALAAEWKNQGQTQREIYNAFEQYRAYLRDEEREFDEDIVMDIMDCITGRCGPHARLFDSYLEL